MSSQTLIHADIFFFISSIGFVLIALAVLIGLAYVVSILRRIDRLTEKIENKVETMEEHTKEFVSDLRDSMAFRMLFGSRKKRRRDDEER